MLLNSLRTFVAWSITGLKSAETWQHKLNVLCLIFLYPFDFILIPSPLHINEKLEKVCNVLAKRTVVNVNGIEFALLDAQSLGIVSTEYSEKWMWHYLKVKKGEVFLDVGAHIGKYTLQVARMTGGGGMVIAVEPHPENYRFLLENVRRNELQNVVAFNIAAWKDERSVELFVGTKAGWHSLKKVHTVAGLRSVMVKARPLDDILETMGVNIDWVKIDVEGAEVEVVQGLWKTLKKDRPNVVVETFYQNVETLKKFMKNLGYNVTPIPQSAGKLVIYLYCSFKERKPKQARLQN